MDPRLSSFRRSSIVMENLTTERTNPSSCDIDCLSAIEIVRLMNAEDAKVSLAVQQVVPSIALAAESIARQLQQGGRLLYLGAGTSGRLGVLDASECPPTFNTLPEQVIGIIAGGPRALTTAIEGAEDDEAAAVDDLNRHRLSASDVLVGIASSGRTPYVLSGLRYARSLMAFTVGLTCNEESELQPWADIVIAPIVGPEVISGSTRLKAGTATKMVLNILTTTSMVLLGKTYGNWMVDLRATNAKLKSRSIRIVSAISGLDARQAAEQLQQCDGEVKTAIVSACRTISPDSARALLNQSGGKLRLALNA